MSRKGFRDSVLLWLLISLAWPGVRGQAQTEEPRYQGRGLAEWQGDLKAPSPEVRRNAVPALVHFGPAAVPALASALKDLHAQVRELAVWGLGQIGPAAKDAVPALGQALGDVSVQVRQTAAWALGMVGPAAKDAVPELTRALKDSGNVVRANAAQALGQIGLEAKGAAVALAQAIWDRNVLVRGSATQALRAIGQPAVSELRKEAEKDPQLEPLLQEVIRIVGGR